MRSRCRSRRPTGRRPARADGASCRSLLARRRATRSRSVRVRATSAAHRVGRALRRPARPTRPIRWCVPRCSPPPSARGPSAASRRTWRAPGRAPPTSGDPSARCSRRSGGTHPVPTGPVAGGATGPVPPPSGHGPSRGRASVGARARSASTRWRRGARPRARGAPDCGGRGRGNRHGGCRCPFAWPRTSRCRRAGAVLRRSCRGRGRAPRRGWPAPRRGCPRSGTATRATPRRRPPVLLRHRSTSDPTRRGRTRRRPAGRRVRAALRRSGVERPTPAVGRRTCDRTCR